ncbi:MAG: anti-sigma factor [Algicola sp.]|nr:anti-sigma factor [Algicola sp.]
MQDDKKEWLSALVDSHADLKDLDQVINSDDNKDTWSRYHLMGDVMRGDGDSIDVNLVNSIEAAIAQEPTIITLAAHRSLRQRFVESPLVQKSSHYIGRSAQFAIAASVALVSVMGVQQYQESADDYSPLAVLQTTGPVNGNISPVSLTVNTNLAVDQREVQRDVLRQQQRINALLFDHQQQLKLNANRSN